MNTDHVCKLRAELATTRALLESYRAQTAPLADYYRGKGTLKSVDGMAPIDAVTSAINGALGRGSAHA